MKYATIFRRIFAYAIDALLVFAVFVWITQAFVFAPIREGLFGSDDWFQSGWKTEIYTMVTISVPVWLYFGLFEISSWRGTIGKRLLNLRTVDEKTRKRIGPAQATLRTLLKMLPWEIAHLSNNLPVPMWYDPDPGFRSGFAVVPLIGLTYIVLVLATEKRQSLHDLAAKTVVVHLSEEGC
jgi:uncharacterized RDD family membrane protein YckC